MLFFEIRMPTEISSYLTVLRNIKKPVLMTTGVARPLDATKTRAKPTQHFCNCLLIQPKLLKIYIIQEVKFQLYC